MTDDRRLPPILYPGGVVISDADRALTYPDDVLRDLVEGWRTARVGRYLVRYDETWRANHAAAGDAEVLLLGSAMDVDAPRASQQEVAERLTAALSASDDAFFDRIDALVGAHILVVRRGDKHWVLSDATAMEPLAYDVGGEGLLVASYPALVAEIRGYELSDLGRLWVPSDPRPEAQQWRLWAGPWHLPGVSTQYAQVRALTPNTRLELGSRTVERIFPRAPIGVQAMDDVVERVGGHLRDACEWVAREFPDRASVSVSGGLDTRLTLAASRDVAEQLRYFTYYYANNPIHRHDLRTARTLAERLRLDHGTWPLNLRRAREGAEAAWERMHHGIHGSGRTELSYAENLPPGDLHVRSNVLEVTRGYFIKNPRMRADTFDPDRLSSIFRPSTAKFFRPQYEEYLAVTGFSAEAKQDMHYTDLYHWEQRLGRWHSELVRRSKVAHNTFIIWNARRVLTLMLARPPEDRWNARVTYRLIDRLWPEVLETPIFSGRRFTAPPTDLRVGPPPFDWSRLAPETRCGFARALGLDAADGEAAARALNAAIPAPGPEHFEAEEMVDAALHEWLAIDPIALDRVYTIRMVPPRARRLREAAAIVSRIDQQRVRPANEAMRKALATSLQAAGGRLPGIVDRATLRPYLRVPTTGLSGTPLAAHEEQLLAVLRSQGERSADGLVELAPRAGGRRVVARRLVDADIRAGRKVLWITQRVELLEQAALAFVDAASLLRERAEPLLLRLSGGAYGPRRLEGLAAEGPDLLLATVAALARNPSELEAYLREHDAVVVVEHAQHAAAPGWREVVGRARAGAGAVLGLVTAGGEAGIAAAAAALGSAVVARQEQSDLLAAGVLAAALPERIETGVSPDAGLPPAEPADLGTGGIPSAVAARLAEDEGRDAQVVAAWQGSSSPRGDGRTLVFAIDPPHARALAERFQAAGARADWISIVRTERQRIVDAFRWPELDVLITADPIPEGIDLPRVETVLLARPVRSPSVLAELCGAGLLGPAVQGTAQVRLVTFADRWQELSGWLEAADLFPAQAPAASGEAAAVYEFEAVIALPDDETEVRRHRIVVHEHQLAGYEALEDAAADDPDAFSASPFELRERFFAGVEQPLPAAQDLAQLAAYAAAHGALPPRTGTA